MAEAYKKTNNGAPAAASGIFLRSKFLSAFSSSNDILSSISSKLSQLSVPPPRSPDCPQLPTTPPG